METNKKYNLVERLVIASLHKKAWKKLINSEENKDIPEFTGNTDDIDEVYKYISKPSVLPIKTIDNNDGTYTCIYDVNGIVVKRIIHATLSGIHMKEHEEINTVDVKTRKLVLKRKQ